MNSLAKWTFYSAAVLSAACVVPVFSGEEKAEIVPGIITQLDLPLEHYPDGSIKTHLVADRAQAKGSVMEINGLTVEITKPTGEVETVIEADTCNFDKEQNLAQSDGPISLTHPDLKVTGVGFRWSSKDERIEVLSNVRVELRKGLDAPLLGR
jgi:hypothetical protein